MTALDNARKHTYTIDTLMQLKDAGAITSSAAAQVGGAAQVLDLGEGFFEGQVLFDISAIDFATENETYQLLMEFSDVEDFSTGTPDTHAIGVLLGDAANGYSNQEIVGQIAVPFTNRWLDADGAPKDKRYMRLYTVVAGTSPSINYTAFVVKPN